MNKALGDRTKIKEFSAIDDSNAIDNGGKYIGDYKKGTKIRHGKGASIWNLSEQTTVAGSTWSQRKVKAKAFTSKYQSWNVSAAIK